METITTLEARKKFGGMLDRVAGQGEHILILRVNRPLAVLIPYADYQQGWDASARQKRLRQRVDQMKNLHAQHGQKIKGLDPVKIVRALRDTR